MEINIARLGAVLFTTMGVIALMFAFVICFFWTREEPGLWTTVQGFASAAVAFALFGFAWDALESEDEF